MIAYLGGKKRLGPELARVMLSRHPEAEVWVEPFCGMASVAWNAVRSGRIRKVYLVDANPNVVEFLKCVKAGYSPPKTLASLTPDGYKMYKEMCSRGEVSADIAFVGTALSFGGKWFGGLAGVNNNSRPTISFFEAGVRGITAYRSALDTVDVYCTHGSAANIEVPTKDLRKSIVYLDPPYTGTTGFADVGSETILDAVKKTKTALGIYLSEYKASETSLWEQVWSKRVPNWVAKDARGSRVEKLFVWNSPPKQT